MKSHYSLPIIMIMDKVNLKRDPHVDFSTREKAVVVPYNDMG